jgi:glycosyltransferase involved in cell wall biosynthesis
MTAVDDQTAIAAATQRPLRILHVMRAPVGGLFRHVADLSRAQARAGHSVGIVADSATGGAEAARHLEALSPNLALGVTRLPMHRFPHPDDLRIAWRIACLSRKLSPDIVHGHGAKGGLFARLPALLPGFPAPAGPVARIYTPHGGSLHFDGASLLGAIFFAAERILARVTDFAPFESDYARQRFCKAVAAPPSLARVVYNGLLPEEFEPVTPADDAADFVFIGEMRVAKGVEDLLRAFVALPIVLQFLGLYSTSVFRSPLHHGLRIAAGWSIVFAFALAIVFFFQLGGSFSRVWLLSWYLSGLALLTVERLAVAIIVRRLSQ